MYVCNNITIEVTKNGKYKKEIGKYDPAGKKDI